MQKVFPVHGEETNRIDAAANSSRCHRPWCASLRSAATGSQSAATSRDVRGMVSHGLPIAKSRERRWLIRFNQRGSGREISASLTVEDAASCCPQPESPSRGDHGRLRRLAFLSGSIHRNVDDLWLVGNREQRTQGHGHDGQERGSRRPESLPAALAGRPTPARRETWFERRPIAPESV